MATSGDCLSLHLRQYPSICAVFLAWCGWASSVLYSGALVHVYSLKLSVDLAWESAASLAIWSVRAWSRWQLKKDVQSPTRKKLCLISEEATTSANCTGSYSFLTYKLGRKNGHCFTVCTILW